MGGLVRVRKLSDEEREILQGIVVASLVGAVTFLGTFVWGW